MRFGKILWDLTGFDDILWDFMILNEIWWYMMGFRLTAGRNGVSLTCHPVTMMSHPCDPLSPWCHSPSITTLPSNPHTHQHPIHKAHTYRRLSSIISCSLSLPSPSLSLSPLSSSLSPSLLLSLPLPLSLLLSLSLMGLGYSTTGWSYSTQVGWNFSQYKSYSEEALSLVFCSTAGI